MRFKVFMINHLGKYHDETVIANNEKDAKNHVQIINPNSKVLRSKWVYK